jgi:uncharacterized membrane protein
MEERKKPKLKSFKAQEDTKRNQAEKFADFLTEQFGSIWFLAINVLWFLIWMVWNTNILPGVEAFDPFPFGLLTMVVSLEAIVLAIVVLISQNRAAKVADLREEIDLQIDVTAETEITKALKMLEILLQKHGVDTSTDKELAHLVKTISPDKIEKSLEKDS